MAMAALDLSSPGKRLHKHKDLSSDLDEPDRGKPRIPVDMQGTLDRFLSVPRLSFHDPTSVSTSYHVPSYTSSPPSQESQSSDRGYTSDDSGKSSKYCPSVSSEDSQPVLGASSRLALKSATSSLADSSVGVVQTQSSQHFERSCLFENDRAELFHKLHSARKGDRRTTDEPMDEDQSSDEGKDDYPARQPEAECQSMQIRSQSQATDSLKAQDALTFLQATSLSPQAHDLEDTLTAARPRTMGDCTEDAAQSLAKSYGHTSVDQIAAEVYHTLYRKFKKSLEEHCLTNEQISRLYQSGHIMEQFGMLLDLCVQNLVMISTVAMERETGTRDTSLKCATKIRKRLLLTNDAVRHSNNSQNTSITNTDPAAQASIKQNLVLNPQKDTVQRNEEHIRSIVVKQESVTPPLDDGLFSGQACDNSNTDVKNVVVSSSHPNRSFTGCSSSINEERAKKTQPMNDDENSQKTKREEKAKTDEVSSVSTDKDKLGTENRLSPQKENTNELKMKDPHGVDMDDLQKTPRISSETNSPPVVTEEERLAEEERLVEKADQEASFKVPEDGDNLHLSENGVGITLLRTSMWRTFNQFGTEMIINRSGRRMFPFVTLQLSGLDQHTMYAVEMEVVPFDNRRYKFVNNAWTAVGVADSPIPNRPYEHPDSPTSGSKWMSKQVQFTRVKLTNNRESCEGNMQLHSMHKYVVQISIRQMSNTFTTPARVFRFKLNLTSFIAVTAYQNELVTKLKIHNNPFAKAFRDSSLPQTNKKGTPKKRSCQTKEDPRPGEEGVVSPKKRETDINRIDNSIGNTAFYPPSSLNVMASRARPYFHTASHMGSGHERLAMTQPPLMFMGPNPWMGLSHGMMSPYFYPLSQRGWNPLRSVAGGRETSTCSPQQIGAGPSPTT